MLTAHRINTAAELALVPPQYGVEIDLRDGGPEVILAHDPFGMGERFEDFLKSYKHAFLILNIKSERIEWRVLELLKEYHIFDYFFLDCSFPMTIALSKIGEKNIALRYSEFEGLETIRLMREHIRWVWVDCFTGIPLTTEIFSEINSLGLRVCLVSPELQGRPQDVDLHVNYFRDNRIKPHMVCAKLNKFEKWQILFN